MSGANGVSSTILYKFRSSTNYESLPMPGSIARLFDIKRAIVKAKKLDKAGASGGLEFDLKVTNATTDEAYTDDNAFLPRGSRLIVQRLPAARGAGLLARIAREEAGMSSAPGPRAISAPGATDRDKYYTITSTENEEDEFVRTNTAAQADDEEDELRALRAVTDPTHGSSTGKTGATLVYNRTGGGAVGGLGGSQASWMKNAQPFRQTRGQPDPEIRDQEQKQTTKKRATGIPRTFLNFVDKPKTDADGGEFLDGGNDGEHDSVRLQPNQLGFQHLLQRADYLKCGICGNVVQNAMLLPWDREGRTACEHCIRPALARNNFVCPLTGTENVSPDELIPNFGLRKAADNFVKSVMDKMEEIEREAQRLSQEESAKDNVTTDNQNLFENAADHGTIESKKMKRHTTQSITDEFGGGHDFDDFGGDVFHVDTAAAEVEVTNGKHEDGLPATLEQNSNDDNTNISPETANHNASDDAADVLPTNVVHLERNKEDDHAADTNDNVGGISIPSQDKSSGTSAAGTSNIPSKDAASPRVAPVFTDHHELQRGPPAGYTIGPAAPTALNNPRMSHAAPPALSTPPQSIPPPPPGLPPSAVQQHPPQRGRGFQPYPQRGHFRGRGGRYGAFNRGAPHDGGRFGGRGDSFHVAGRGNFRQQAPEFQGVAPQLDDFSAASIGKGDGYNSIKEKEDASLSVKSPEDRNKSNALKRSRSDEDDASESQSENSGARGQSRQWNANSYDLPQNPPPQARPYTPHHSRGGRGAYRPPGPGHFPPGRGDRGRWPQHGHMPPQVAPGPYHQPPPYDFNHGGFGARGRGRDFRGSGTGFYRGGRF